MTEPLLSKTVSNHALSPQRYNCTSKDTITGIFMWIYLCKNIFSLLHFTQVCVHRCSTKYMFFKNSTKCTGNCLYQTLLTLSQMCSWEYFEIFRNTFFIEHLRTTASDFISIFLLFKMFLFQIRSIFV